MRRLVLASLLLLSETLGGCQTAAPDVAADYERAVATLLCEPIFPCETRHPALATARLVYTSADECIARGGFFPAVVAPEVRAALERGTLELDEEAFAQCLEAMKVVCPYTSDEMPGACGRLLAGRVRLGGACSLPNECAEGRCDIAEGATCGTCVAASAAIGEPCSTRFDCATSALGPVECAADANHVLRCRHEPAFTAVPAGLGAPCGLPPGENGEVATCAPGLYCDAGHLCATRLPTGAECAPDLELCEAGAACFAVAGDVARCRTLVYSDVEGASCALTGPELARCDWGAGLTCDLLSTTCVRLGDGSEGAVCDSSRSCDPGLFCGEREGPLGACARTYDDGAACARDDQCRTGHCAKAKPEDDVGTCAAAPLVVTCGRR